MPTGKETGGGVSNKFYCSVSGEFLMQISFSFFMSKIVANLKV
jgi:hypothetical protein